MRMIITGGTGLIGKALIALLLSDKHEVIVLSRNPRSATLPAGVSLVRWDGVSTEGWRELVDGADAVVNLAGESIAGSGTLPGRWTQQRKRRILQSRLQATRAVVQGISEARHPPAVLVQGSAVGYYGARLDDSVLDERASPGDDFLAGVVRQWEAASQPVETAGVRRVLARTGLVLSKDGGSLPPMLLPYRFFMGGPLGSGRQWWPWIHIRDEARALYFLITDPRAAGPFNLVAPQPVTNHTFAVRLGEILKRPAQLSTPAFILRLALGEMSELLLAGQRAIPAHLQQLGFQFQFPALESALRNLLT